MSAVTAEDIARKTIEQQPDDMVNEVIDQVSPATPRQRRADDDDAQYPLLAGATILLVDDCRTARMGISRQLREFGAEVEEAEDGRTALAILRTAGFNGLSYDLIITDLNMPSMDGLSLIRAIRIDTGLHHIPVVVVSSDTEDDSILRCAKHGISSYLIKPPKPDQLAKTLEESLRQANARKPKSNGQLSEGDKCELIDLVRKAARVANGLGESMIDDPDQNRIVKAVKRWLAKS